MGKDKSEEPVGPLERGTTALLAGSVLLAAAAINKVPGIECAAMAQTYAGAVTHFGLAALCGGLCYAGLKKWPGAAWVILIVGGFVFYLSVYVAAVNLQRAATWCTVGDHETHARMPLDLLGLTTFWKTLPAVNPDAP